MRHEIPQETLEAQRKAASPATSAWASANAGAGKTFVLTARVARLLLAGQDPARILCLTYTRAAAAEMTNRLFALLGRWSTMPDTDLTQALSGLIGDDIPPTDLNAARRLFARALETPGGLKIQTIHAFSQSLLGRFPLEAGLAPAFDLMADQETEDAIKDILGTLLQYADDKGLTEALDILLAEGSETGFEDLVRTLLGLRLTLQSLTLTDENLSRAIADIHKALGCAPGATEHSLITEAMTPPALDLEALEATASALLSGSKTDVERGESVLAILKESDPHKAYEQYRQIFLTGKGEARKRGLMTKGLAARHGGLMQFLEKEMIRVLHLEDRIKAAKCAMRSGAMLTLAARLYRRYGALKLRKGLLDYDDLLDRTLTLLQGDGAGAWVLYKLDAGIDHILIDEAQDTSPTQWEIIRRLADEFFTGNSAAEARDRARTIFAVGDEKQSIYSFQGAEPAAFARMRRHFENQTGATGSPFAPVPLTLSFRSAPAILQAVDFVFAEERSARMVSVGGETVRHEPLRKNDTGVVELWPLAVSDEVADSNAWDAPLDRVRVGSGMAKLAARIATTIAGWLKDGEWLAAKSRPIRPGDVLILVRRRNAFADHLIRDLKRQGIPVAGADRLKLTDHIAVMDLIAAGRFALLPRDDLTLACLLKSPFIGLDEDDLFTLAHDREASLWQALKDRGGEHPHWTRARETLERILARGRVLPAAEFYGWLLGENGGRRDLLTRLGADAADPIDEFMALAETEDGEAALHLEAFLDQVERKAPEIKRDMDTGKDHGAQGEVRVMTVHGAKGLEAPVVILPDTCSMPDGKHDPKVLTSDQDPEDKNPPLALWRGRQTEDPEEATRLRAALAEKREAEYRRLLYVAMTRAEDRLYICGYQGKDATLPEGCWYALCQTALEDVAHTIPSPWRTTGDEEILRLGAPDSAPASSQSSEATETPSSPASAPFTAAPSTPALPDWARASAPAEPDPARTLAPSHIAADTVPSETPLPVMPPLARQRGDRFQRGRLVHKLLQMLPDAPRDDREAMALRFLTHPVHGLAEETAQALYAEVKAVMEDPDLALLFGPGSRAEVPIAGHATALGQGIVIDGQVDRLVVTPDLAAVVDFKTDRPAPEDSSAVADPYITQMALYRALLQDAFPGRPIACVLLWTAGPHAMTLPAARLDAALDSVVRRHGVKGPVEPHSTGSPRS